jgi:hypothetical protein
MTTSDELTLSPTKATHSGSGDYLAARAAFVDAVRQELGI